MFYEILYKGKLKKIRLICSQTKRIFLERNNVKPILNIIIKPIAHAPSRQNKRWVLNILFNFHT